MQTFPTSYPDDPKLDEIVANLPNEETEYPTSDEESSDSAHMRWMKLYAERLPDELLPDFTSLPPIGKQLTVDLVDVIDYTAGDFTVTLTDDESGEVIIKAEGFNALKACYDYKHEHREGTYKLVDLNLTAEVKKYFKKDLFGYMFSMPDDPYLNISLSGGNPSIFASYSIRDSYAGFLKTTQAWLKNPNDLLLSWYFLKTHPIFWQRNEYGYTDPDKDSFKNSLWHDLGTYSDTGGVYHEFETGASVPPKYKERYHDPRLDVNAPTYDEGIIQLAHLVHKFYNWDGVEREDVDYEKQEFELILEERIADMDAHADDPSYGHRYLL